MSLVAFSGFFLRFIAVILVKLIELKDVLNAT